MRAEDATSGSGIEVMLANECESIRHRISPAFTRGPLGRAIPGEHYPFSEVKGNTASREPGRRANGSLLPSQCVGVPRTDEQSHCRPFRLLCLAFSGTRAR